MELRLKRVVIRVVAIAVLIDALRQPEQFVEWAPRIDIARTGNRLIAIQSLEKMPPDISHVSDFERQSRRQLVLDSEIPEIHQRDSVGIQGIREVVDAEPIWKRISAVRSDRRLRRRRRPVQQIERRDINIGLVHALGIHDGRIVIRALSEHGSQAARIEAASISRANDRLRRDLISDSDTRRETEIVRFHSEIQRDAANAGDEHVASRGIEAAGASRLRGRLG